VNGISKYEVVKKIALEMVMGFAWTEAVLRVCDGEIVHGQSLEREKIWGIICGVCGGRGILYSGPHIVLVNAVETTITGSGRPIKSAYSSRDSGSIDRSLRHTRATAATATGTTWMT
jgi:hypothetical protein